MLEGRSRLVCEGPEKWDVTQVWETDFYTPPVLGGVAFFDNSAPAVYKLQGP